MQDATNQRCAGCLTPSNPRDHSCPDSSSFDALCRGCVFRAPENLDPEKYRKQRFLDTLVVVIAAAIIIILWARVVPRSSTFLGLIGAGLAVALREPLLSIAGRLAIFAGHMFTVKDRVQINQLSGDIIDIGFFYTRMLEIGNWISGD